MSAGIALKYALSAQYRLKIKTEDVMYVVSRKTTGYKKLQKGLACEDFVLTKEFNDFVIMACADGHGDRKCKYAAKGAELATWVITKVLQDMRKVEDSIEDYGTVLNDSREEIIKKFICGWVGAVLDDYKVNHPEDTTFQQEFKEFSKYAKKKWFLFNSGGVFRRWYGNIINVVNWENGGFDIKATRKAIIPSEERYFDELISWNKISSGKISVRYQPEGIIPGDASPFYHSIDHNREEIMYAMAVMNRKVSAEILKVISPTLNFEVGNIAKIPVDINEETKSKVLPITVDNVKISCSDWDAFEISWNFKTHPLFQLASFMKYASETEKRENMLSMKHIQNIYELWKENCYTRFNQLKSNEEELNRIFIDIYGLQDELTPEIEDKDITVYQIFDTKEDVPESMKGSNYVLTRRDVIVSLISYAVGCMFGRYSLDVEGLAYAGGDWDSSKYTTYIPDEDNSLPITDEE